MDKNPNWGGKSPGAGLPRQYIRIEKRGHTELSEREQITPESDLTFCIAEMDVDENDTRRGIVIGDIWYGASEALAIARLIGQNRSWLMQSEGTGEFYTYSLAYPESMGGAVFYVGKGKGDRINDHEKEARQGHQCQKCDIIRQIWKQGEQVAKRKEQEHLGEDDALTIESRLMKQHRATIVNSRRQWTNPMTSDERRQLIEYTKSLPQRYTQSSEHE